MNKAKKQTNKQTQQKGHLQRRHTWNWSNTLIIQCFRREWLLRYTTIQIVFHHSFTFNTCISADIWITEANMWWMKSVTLNLSTVEKY